MTALLALGLAPFGAKAQRVETPYRVALVVLSAPVSAMVGAEPAHPLVRAFVHELRDLGYVEGRNLLLDRYSLEGNRARAAEIVAEALRLKPDVIVASANPITHAAKRATPTVPIVMAGNVVPVQAGLVASLARPGGNVTGLSFDVSGGAERKRLELLKEAAPKILRVAFLGSEYSWKAVAERHLQTIAGALNIELVHAATKGNDVATAFPIATRERVDAIFVAADVPNYHRRRRIVEYAAQSRMPAIYAHGEAVKDGGLMSYALSATDLYRRTAVYVDKILKGAKPADLPVEQPTKFDLAVNIKTAKALGLAIPPSILLRADRIVE